jgi:predicted dinucleotide-binding enzyme
MSKFVFRTEVEEIETRDKFMSTDFAYACNEEEAKKIVIEKNLEVGYETLWIGKLK